MRTAILLALGLVTAAVAAAPSIGAALPKVTISATGAGYAKTLEVTVETASGKPVKGAVVTASATMKAPGHFMSVAPARLKERSGGRYAGGLRFVMLGQWTVKVEVSGQSIRPVTARLTIRL